MPAKATTTTSKKASIKEYFYGLGKRKTAVARVRLYKNGKGQITVNDKEFKDYFAIKTLHEIIKSPLKITSLVNKFDIIVKVIGGGVNAQADAIRHGIARAILEYDKELRSILKKAGFLTRDARKKERKKPGLRKARRAPQFSKR